MSGADESSCLSCWRELADVLECLPEAAVLIDREHRILAANQLYCKGVTVSGRLRGRRCYEVFHGYRAPCETVGESCPMRAASASMEPTRILHIHQTSEGEEHQDITVLPVKSRSGKIRAFIEMVRRPRIASTCARRDGLVGKAPHFTRMLELVQRVAPSHTPVLLLGESGTGKELVAAAVHQLSESRRGPFVPLDCSGLSESLFESELFGYERGAFTGAWGHKIGLVEAANGGTLFLDEVGDIPLNLQVKLLRLLETGQFRRVGSVEPLKTDFRLVCATHRDLGRMVEEGQFRQDLYFRISTYPVRLPPLRERIEDLPLLADSLLERFSNGKHYRIHEETLLVLAGYGFPGNVRELSNLLERACLLADGELILPEHLPRHCTESSAGPALSEGKEIMPLEQIELRYLMWAASRFEGDKASLARKLGVAERTLYRKLKKARKHAVAD